MSAFAVEVDQAAALFQSGRLPEAAEQARRARELYRWRQLHPEPREAASPAPGLPDTADILLRCLAIEGFARVETGPWTDALALAEEALEVACAMPDPQAPAPTLNLLAGLHARLERYDSAEMLSMRALAMARQGFDDRTTAQCFNTLVATMLEAHDDHLRAGRTEAAAALLQRMEPLARQARAGLERESDPFRAAILRCNLAGVDLLCGRLDEAERNLRAVLQAASSAGFALVVSRALSRLARCLWLQGDVDGARRGFLQVWQRVRSGGHRLAQEDTLGWLQTVAAARGRPALARRLGERAMRLARQRRAQMPWAETGGEDPVPAVVYRRLEATGH